MTPLDARYLFHLEGPPLTDHGAESCRAIPGVIVRNRTRATSSRNRVPYTVLDVPYSGGFAVERVLTANAVPYRVEDPAQTDRQHGIVSASLASEACAWLWADTEPTVAEPIRLLPYQRNAILEAYVRGGGHLWAPPGAGKTVTAHTWMLAICQGPCVIVTRSDARETHRRELVRCSAAEPFVWKPSSQVRKRDRWPDVYAYLIYCVDRGQRPVVIVGWDMLPNIVDCLVADVGAEAVVLDESHRAKAPRRLKWTVRADGKLSSQELKTVSMAAFKLAEAATYRLATTATAIRHRTWDLWGQLTLVEPTAWGKTITRFAKRYCNARPGEYGGLDMSGRSNTVELKARLSFTVSHVSYAVLAEQLPAKRRQVIRIPPEKLVKALSRSKVDALELRKIKAQAAKGSGKARNRLNEVRLEDAASRKRKAVVTLVRDYMQTGKGKVLVLTGRRRDCEDLGERIGKLPDLTAWWAHGDAWGANEAAQHVLDGVDPDSGPRMRIQDAYMGHTGPCCIVGTIDAWGESRNLQDTDVLLCVQLPYTPGKVDQMEGRVQRLGMSRPVLVAYVVAEDTIDERVAALMIDKLPAVQDVTGGGALEGLATSLKGLDDREAVLASLAAMFGPIDEDGEE